MRHPVLWRCILVAFFPLICSSSLLAQLPQNLETCEPITTFAQEIKTLNEPVARIVVDQVKIDGTTHLPPAILQETILNLTHHDFDDDQEFVSVWLEKLLAPWRDHGYFQARATADPELLQRNSTTTHVRMVVRIDEGGRFRLGNVQFRSADPDEPLVLPAQELRKSIRLNGGDIFSAAQVREGLDVLHRLYASRGYIDMVATPLVDVDLTQRRIALVIEIDQQNQFRVDKVEVLGLEPAMEALLKSKLKRGEPYDAPAIDDFLKQNAASLPPYVTPASIQIHRDRQTGALDFRLSVVQDCLSVYE